MGACHVGMCQQDECVVLGKDMEMTSYQVPLLSPRGRHRKILVGPVDGVKEHGDYTGIGRKEV